MLHRKYAPKTLPTTLEIAVRYLRLYRLFSQVGGT
jgi:hypothetical protein